MTTLILEAVAIWIGLCILVVMFAILVSEYNERRTHNQPSRRCALCAKRPVARGEYICGPCCAHLIEGPGPNHDRRLWR